MAFGALSLASTIVIIISARLTRRAVRQLEGRVVSRSLVALQLMRVAGRALFALAPSWGLALVPYFFESIVRASFYPLFNAWLIRRTDEDVRATVLSTTSVSNALGQMGGGPISGAIGNLYGIPAALPSSAALLFPGALFFAHATGLRAGRDPQT